MSTPTSPPARAIPKKSSPHLQKEIGLTPTWTIADFGSGTGISSELFLSNGNRVLGVEPNAPMRSAAEKSLRGFYANFQSVDGSSRAHHPPRQFHRSHNRRPSVPLVRHRSFHPQRMPPHSPPDRLRPAPLERPPPRRLPLPRRLRKTPPHLRHRLRKSPPHQHRPPKKSPNSSAPKTTAPPPSPTPNTSTTKASAPA